MKHIRQIGSSFDPSESYIVVKTDDWSLPLEVHPSMIEHPEFFEIADCDLPTNFSYLIYQNETN